MNLQLKSFVFFLFPFFVIVACNQKTTTVKIKDQKPVAKTFAKDSTNIWKDIETPPQPDNGTVRPDKFRILSLDLGSLKNILAACPKEKDKQIKPGVMVNIPLPEGNYQMFEVYETEVMAPELAAKFPEIKSFGGNGVTDKTLSLRMDYSPNGFHGFIITLKGGVNIDPYSRAETNKYICYYKQDFSKEQRQQMPVDSVK